MARCHITRGDGPPTTAPLATGDHYNDDTNGIAYISQGTASVADWVPVVDSSAPVSSNASAVAALQASQTAQDSSLAALSSEQTTQNAAIATNLAANTANGLANASNATAISDHVGDTSNPHDVTLAQVIDEGGAIGNITLPDLIRLFTDDNTVDDLHRHSSLSTPDGDGDSLVSNSNGDIAICSDAFYGHNLQVGNRNPTDNSDVKSIAIYGGETPDNGMSSLGLFESIASNDADLGVILRYNAAGNTPGSNGEFQLVGSEVAAENIFLRVNRNDGVFTFAGQNLKAVADPVDAQDVVTRSYSDAADGVIAAIMDAHVSAVSNPHDTTLLGLEDVTGNYTANSFYMLQANAAGNGVDLWQAFEATAVRLDPLLHQAITFQEYLVMNVDIPVTGDYLFQMTHRFSLNAANVNFESHLEKDGDFFLINHVEPADSFGTGIVVPNSTGGTTNTGTDNFTTRTGFKKFVGLAAGPHTFRLEYRGQTANQEATIYEAEMYLKRIAE